MKKIKKRGAVYGVIRAAAVRSGLSELELR